MTTETATPAQKFAYPPSRAAWSTVFLLTLAYIFSFVDRYILGLLIEPIKADLGLSDAQIGLLLGFAFAIFYATMGLPLGWLADRWRRTWIVGIGIAIWSAATVASGFAKNFIHLFFARMTVGAGEATLSPCAMSIIADSFPKEKRGRPIGFYSSALSIGAGLASLIGAAVLAWANTTSSISLPGLGELRPWQFTFIIVGAPGLLVALPFFMMREPARNTASAEDASQMGSSPFDMLWYFFKYFGTFATFLSLVCVMTIIAYSQGWYAAMFTRTWGWPAEQYALINGIVTLALGPATVNAAGWLSDRWTQKGRRDAPLMIMIVAAIVMVPTAAIAPLMPSPEIAFGVLALNTISIAALSAVSVTALLNIVPSRIRAQIVALYYMAISFAGLFLGPQSVGLLSTHVFGEDGLRYAVAAVPVIFGTIPLLLIPFTRRFYLRRMNELDAA